MIEVDAFDGTHWYKSTLLSTKEVEISGKIRVEAHIAYRVYREATPQRQERDALGSYNGMDQERDEWVPLYSPRIAPIATRVVQNVGNIPSQPDELSPST